MDVGTGLAALGTAQLSKEMIGKILGPTAEYIGAGAQSWTERRVSNLRRVLGKANARLGDGVNSPGEVPPRVLKAVMEEAEFAEDELTAEYLGGVLASSRTENGRDDRAASIAKLITNLSTYALRTHYIVYAAAREFELGRDPNRWRTGHGKEDTRTFMSSGDYVKAMDFNNAELAETFGIYWNSILSLSRNDLINRWASGNPEILQRAVPSRSFPSNGMIYDLSKDGIALFCAAHGISGDPFVAFVDSSIDMTIPDVPLPDVTRIKDLPARDAG